MLGANKRSYVLKQTYKKKVQVCLSMCELLLPPGINLLEDQKFVWM